MKWFRKILTAFRKAGVRIERRYQFEFSDRSGVRVWLSTHRPRFEAVFSEPPSVHSRYQYDQFRAEILAQFERETGTKISKFELENESARPVTYPIYDEPPHPLSSQEFSRKIREGKI